MEYMKEKADSKQKILTLLLRPKADNIISKRSSRTSSLSSKTTTMIVSMDDKTLSGWSSLQYVVKHMPLVQDKL